MSGEAPEAVNYLAHALLAGADDDCRFGGIIGDFVKGPLAPAGLAEGVLRGVVLHRKIDGFADGHPAFRRSRQRISGARRRYAGVIVDLFYDHFLAVFWSRYCATPLEAFAAEVYALLERRPLPGRLATIFPRMREEDWLTGYRRPEAVALALERIAEHRARPGNPLAAAGEELAREYQGLASDFLEFFPAVEEFAGAFIGQAPKTSPGGSGRVACAGPWPAAASRVT
ncbi:acyl carrier protein phosphodiesterase [Accumulibacter sp.]|uniref:acyl carrier protein phosphodiesterase n=1 Tax=Accumulibacter sp. TaxID=2053492 RepID=UPI0025D5A3CB|nr:acyl carrier protein phosphodiesterase [Accumulibacter sp.]MCM8595020.1 acyl carrier protein phosphodiesterase [Accumulibacter sp.]MCM8625403.1 acyl carrier protein phosphodiesterase [Accumulibacter sp.]MDS4049166.1 acyl carrier protein phosphodiesterase [Accumulibacter sp.]